MRFFVLEPVGLMMFSRKYSYLDVRDPVHIGEPEENGCFCPRCGKAIGMRPWLPPQRGRISRGMLGDFLWGAGFDLVVSDRVRTAYTEADLNGITRFDPPIELAAPKSVLARHPVLPSYHNVRIADGAASLDDRASRAVRLARLCRLCRQGITAVARVELEPGSWNGNDIFYAWGLPGNILVSQRFAQMIRESGLTGADLIPAERYHFDSRLEHRGWNDNLPVPLRPDEPLEGCGNDRLPIHPDASSNRVP